MSNEERIAHSIEVLDKLAELGVIDWDTFSEHDELRDEVAGALGIPRLSITLWYCRHIEPGIMHVDLEDIEAWLAHPASTVDRTTHPEG